jgi:hypothetical protein
VEEGDGLIWRPAGDEPALEPGAYPLTLKVDGVNYKSYSAFTLTITAPMTAEVDRAQIRSRPLPRGLPGVEVSPAEAFPAQPAIVGRSSDGGYLRVRGETRDTLGWVPRRAISLETGSKVAQQIEALPVLSGTQALSESVDLGVTPPVTPLFDAPVMTFGPVVTETDFLGGHVPTTGTLVLTTTEGVTLPVWMIIDDAVAEGAFEALEDGRFRWTPDAEEPPLAPGEHTWALMVGDGDAFYRAGEGDFTVNVPLSVSLTEAGVQNIRKAPVSLVDEVTFEEGVFSLETALVAIGRHRGEVFTHLHVRVAGTREMAWIPYRPDRPYFRLEDDEADMDAAIAELPELDETGRRLP